MSAGGTVKPASGFGNCVAWLDTVENVTVSPESTVTQRIERGIEKPPVHGVRSGVQSVRGHCIFLHSHCMMTLLSPSSLKFRLTGVAALSRFWDCFDWPPDTR
jgi:hypothetical protein